MCVVVLLCSLQSDSSERVSPFSPEVISPSKDLSSILADLTTLLDKGREEELEECMNEYDIIEINQLLQENHFSKEVCILLESPCMIQYIQYQPFILNGHTGICIAH